VEIVTLDLLKLMTVNMNGLQPWRGVGPALPHPDCRQVIVPEDPELVEVPMDPEETVEAPGDDDVLWELPGGVGILPPPDPVEVPEALPPLPPEADELMPELPSPPLPQEPETTDLRDEFDPPQDEEVPPEVPPLIVEAEGNSSRPRRSRQPPPHLRDYDVSTMTKVV